MKILFVTNDSGGFREEREVEDETTIGAYFKTAMGQEVIPTDYMVRVNGEAVGEGHVLTENCRVTITPTKIKGAA